MSLRLLIRLINFLFFSGREIISIFKGVIILKNGPANSLVGPETKIMKKICNRVVCNSKTDIM